MSATAAVTHTRANTHRDPAWTATSSSSKHARKHEPFDAGEQNQVMPFRFDDGEDDLEEIRRRRFSSGSDSSSFSDVDDRSRARRFKPQSNLWRERENEWERASSRAPSSSSNGDGDGSNDVKDNESDDDDEYARRPYPTTTKSRIGKAREEPESPRKHHQHTQQSDESHSDESDNAKATIKPASVAAARAPAVAVTPPVIARLAPPAIPVDLSRISKLAVFPGSETQLLQGHIVRVKTLLHPQYHFFIKDQLVLMAEKQPKNRTSNYHIFDMTRTTALSAKLTKKSGNYIGKLRSNFSKRKSVLIGNLSRKTELGAILFASTTSSSEPRHLSVILPALSAKRQEVEGLTVGDSATSFSLLLDIFQSEFESKSGAHRAAALPTPLQVFENKAPVFDNGYYRLNFNGRVSVPSVKNFQLVHAGAKHAVEHDVCLQFGKVDDKKFHLDFRAPLTPIQAFAIAIAQFNL